MQLGTGDFEQTALGCSRLGKVAGRDRPPKSGASPSTLQSTVQGSFLRNTKCVGRSSPRTYLGHVLDKVTGDSTPKLVVDRAPELAVPHHGVFLLDAVDVSVSHCFSQRLATHVPHVSAGDARPTNSGVDEGFEKLANETWDIS